MEALRDVRRRVFDQDFLACTGRVRAILWLARRRIICKLVHLRQHSADKRWRLEHKVQECLVVRDRLHEIVRLELRHSIIRKRRKQTRALEEGFIISQVSGSNLFCTHLVNDRLGKHIDFTRETEAGEGDRKIDALLAIIDTLVDLLDSKRWQSIRDTLRDGHFERIQHGSRGVRPRYIW
jgi:hypothetical protein